MVEDLDDWVAGWSVQGGINVADTIEYSKEEGKGKHSIKANSQKEDFGYDGSSITSFLAQMDGAVEA